jgi:hypothetical protein
MVIGIRESILSRFPVECISAGRSIEDPAVGGLVGDSDGMITRS